MKANVLEQGPIPETEVFIFLITYLGRRIAYHIIIDVKLIKQEVNVKQQTKAERNPSFHRGSIEIDPLQQSRQGYVKNTDLMNFVGQ